VTAGSIRDREQRIPRRLTIDVDLDDGLHQFRRRQARDGHGPDGGRGEGHRRVARGALRV